MTSSCLQQEDPSAHILHICRGGLNTGDGSSTGGNTDTGNGSSATGDDNSSSISVSISSNDSDEQIKQAVASLEKIAARYSLSTTALDNVVAKASDPMSATDKAEIVAAFSNVVSKIKDIQNSDQNTVDQNTGDNASDPNHANTGYTTNLSGTAAANKRLSENKLVPVKPDYDTTPINPHDKKYLIDTTGLRGQKMVMLEDMSTGQGTKEDQITSEVDVNNTKQTVRVTNPAIHTMQTVNNKKNFVLKGDGSNVQEPIVDKVSFTDFAPGEKMVLTAVEMDAGTQQPVILDNQYLIGRKSLTPTTSDGVATVQFNEFDGAPNARYMTPVLNSAGLVTNSVVNDGISSAQDSDNNSDAVNRDETNDEQADGSVTGAYQGVAGLGLGTDDTDAETDTTAYNINLQSLNSLAALSDGDQAKWVAYETAQSADGNVVAEHKDASDTGQTISITHNAGTTDNNAQGGLTVNNQNGQKQGNDGSLDSHNANNPSNGGSISNGSNPTNGSNPSNGGSLSNGSNPTTGSSTTPGSQYTTTQPGQNGTTTTQVPSQLPSQARSVFSQGQPLQGTTYVRPSVTRPTFGQTGGTDKLSNNWFYNFIYRFVK